VYDVFYSQRSHKHVSAVIAAIIKAMLLLQEYKCKEHHSAQTEKYSNILIINHFNLRLHLFV